MTISVTVSTEWLLGSVVVPGVDSDRSMHRFRVALARCVEATYKPDVAVSVIACPTFEVTVDLTATELVKHGTPREVKEVIEALADAVNRGGAWLALHGEE